MRAKILPTIAACCALSLTGCFLVPAPFAGQLNPVIARYRSIEKGQPRAELESQLGRANREEKEGAAVWETRFDEFNYTTLKVWFDGQDKAGKIEITRAHGQGAPVRLSAVASRTK